MRKRYYTVLSLIIWQSSIFILLLSHMIDFPQFFALGLLAQLSVSSLRSPEFCEPGYLRFIRYYNILGILVFVLLIIEKNLDIVPVDWFIARQLEEPVVNIPTLGILIILSGLGICAIGEGISSRDLRRFQTGYGMGSSYNIDPARSVYFALSPDQGKIIQSIPVLSPPSPPSMRTEFRAVTDNNGLWIQRISKGSIFLQFLTRSFNFHWPLSQDEAFRAIEEIFKDILEIDDRFAIRTEDDGIIVKFHSWPRISDFVLMQQVSLPGYEGIDDLLINYIAGILVIGFRQAIRVDRIDVDQVHQVFQIRFTRMGEPRTGRV
jgi:hypothetical protein